MVGRGGWGRRGGYERPETLIDPQTRQHATKRPSAKRQCCSQAEQRTKAEKGKGEGEHVLVKRGAVAAPAEVQDDEQHNGDGAGVAGVNHALCHNVCEGQKSAASLGRGGKCGQCNSNTAVGCVCVCTFVACLVRRVKFVCAWNEQRY